MPLTPLFLGIFSFLGGVFVSDIFREYWVFNGIFLFFLGAFFFRHHSKILTFLGAGISGFILGCVFLFFSLPSEISPFNPLTDQMVSLKGTVVSFPKYKKNKLSFALEISEFSHTQNTEKKFINWQALSEKPLLDSLIHQDNGAYHSPEKILVGSRSSYMDIAYGDQVLVTGILRKPGKIEGFSYDRFLEKEGIYFTIPSSVISLSPPQELGIWRNFWKKAFMFRSQFEAQIRQKLPVVEAEYAIAIILGSEWGLPDAVLQEFNDTGLRHLLALSGFNITILILILFQIFFFVPKKIRIFLALFSITFFVIVTGASSSVVRAALMGGLGLIILHSGRGSKQNIPLFLLLTLFIMTLWSPFVLVSDVSLQFSVLAVLGLFFLVPYFQETFPQMSKNFPFVSEILFATLAAQIFTLPLSLVLFGNFSLIAPLANLIVAPLTSFAMLMGFLVAIPYMGWICMPFAYALLHFSLSVAHIFSLPAFAALPVPSLPKWLLFPMFGVLFLGVWRIIIHKK